MSGFVPIKCESTLKVLGLSTDIKLTAKCITKKMIRKSAESAIVIFRATDVLNNPAIRSIVFDTNVRQYFYLYNKKMYKTLIYIRFKKEHIRLRTDIEYIKVRKNLTIIVFYFSFFVMIL